MVSNPKLSGSKKAESFPRGTFKDRIAMNMLLGEETVSSLSIVWGVALGKPLGSGLGGSRRCYNDCLI